MKALISSVLILSLMAALAMTATAAQDYNTLTTNGEITVGMTFTDVVAVWGNPQIVEQEICNNRVTNYWFMENGWAIIFCDGEVVNLCPGWSAQ